ncbi:MAG: hypothetical protein LBT99_01840, partial [Bifidobacteriaceae bacterium]|nr:hypothetical protein [Bifidobacteriaceae bacterium]
MTNYTLTGNQYEIKYIDNKNRKHILSLASIGASIRQYTIDSLDIVTPYPTNQIPQYFQGQVLFPWANRLEDGLYEFEDQTIQTNINEIDKNNQLHGLSPLYSFELINQGENWITLGLDLPPQKAYPFSINTQIKYKLTDSGLIIESQIHNNGNKN